METSVYRPASRVKKRPIWPAALIATAALMLLSRLLSSSVTLIAAGLAGLVFTAALVPSMKRRAETYGDSASYFLLGLWIVLCTMLSLSFIRSGIANGRGKAAALVAAGDVRSAVLALAVTTLWLAAVRIPRRNGPAYTGAVTIALLEVARLLAFSITPQIISYVVWAVCATVAWRALTYRSELDF